MLCLNKTGGKTTRQMGEISKDPDGPGCIPDQPHETLQGREGPSTFYSSDDSKHVGKGVKQ